MRGPWRMKLIVVLSLLIAVSCLNGCGGRTPPASMSWVKPIYLHQDTLEWLNGHKDEWPVGLVDDLNQIDKHNTKCREILGIE